jgi:hypothetical protein
MAKIYKHYVIKFFYFTDCRFELGIVAPDAVSALVQAGMKDEDAINWCENGKGFFIKIEII